MAFSFWFSPAHDSADDGGYHPRPHLSIESTDIPADEPGLIERLRDGDPTALERLHERYWERLVRYANRTLGSLDAARDVVQDVFTDLWIRRTTWTPKGTVASYLHRAVRNRAFAQLRTHDTAARLSAGVKAHATAPVRGDELLAAAELHQLVHTTLETLGARCREVYLLRAEQGLEVAETAAVMGITEGTVRLQLSRAVAAIRASVRAYLAQSERPAI
jgi:RNA polymerase sigma-70 factor (ECF subfamily)